jgi:hypothetical protein
MLFFHSTRVISLTAWLFENPARIQVATTLLHSTYFAQGFLKCPNERRKTRYAAFRNRSDMKLFLPVQPSAKKAGRTQLNFKLFKNFSISRHGLNFLHDLHNVLVVQHVVLANLLRLMLH